MATSPLPSQGPHSGEKSIWLHHPCLLGVPIVGRVQYGGWKWVKMVENGQHRVTIQMCHIQMHRKLKKNSIWNQTLVKRGQK